MKKILLLSMIAIFMLGFSFLDGKYKKVKSDKDIVKIPMSELPLGKANYYKYSMDGKDIKFFLVKLNDGNVRAAFDACDVCYPAKKGYSQNQNFMVCNNCGRKFNINSIGYVSGGCNPSPLYITIDKNNVVITVRELSKHLNYF